MYVSFLCFVNFSIDRSIDGIQLQVRLYFNLRKEHFKDSVTCISEDASESCALAAEQWVDQLDRLAWLSQASSLAPRVSRGETSALHVTAAARLAMWLTTAI
jgi:hypothetical protein